MTPTEELRAMALRRLQEDAGELAVVARGAQANVGPEPQSVFVERVVELADRVAEWAERVQQLEGRA